jgi:glutathione S-transferase
VLHVAHALLPILVDDGRTIVESTIIIEHLMLKHGGRVRWLPVDPLEALEVRFLDRFFDNDVMTAMQKPVFEAIKKDNARIDEAMAEAGRVLDLAYGWLEQRLEGRTWAAGETLSLADCAAAPSLFYADWVHPIAQTFP